MSITIEDFEDYFGALHRNESGKPTPFPWQTRLAKLVLTKGWPDCIDLPTASGKTACIDIAVFSLACQATLPIQKRNLGRRVFFAVNRRVIVDEAYERVFRIAERLLQAEENEQRGILGKVARALRSLNEEQDPCRAPPLGAAQLRGGIWRDTAWIRSATQPMVVCTTADQLGSRLLFRGYGVSDSMKPIHAALCACDSVVLLDEAHVTRAFCQTMQLIPRYQAQHATAPSLTFVQMTATPTGDVAKRFQLNGADYSHPVLKARQKAPKPARLVELDKKEHLSEVLACMAVDSLSGERRAVGVIVNRVQTARDVAAGIRASLARKGVQGVVHVVIGRMRPIDRDRLQNELRTIVGPDRPDVLDRPVFVVATQCLEVGADYDFDALVTECASMDALRQRFGRLNRSGRDIDAAGAIVATEEALKGDDPIYGDAIKHSWEWLQANSTKDDEVDFGIAAFRPLWAKVESQAGMYLEPDCINPLLAPAADAAVLLPAHLDALCQTAPQPVPSPDVSYFIHGPQRDNAEVSVCWRADFRDVGPDEEWCETVRLLPPSSPECMTVPLRDVRRYLEQRKNDLRDADVPVVEVEGGPDVDDDTEKAPTRIVIWRGNRDVHATRKASDLRPGDVVVMPVASRSWNYFGHVPGAQPSDYERIPGESDDHLAARVRDIDRRADLAECATEQSRRRIVRRIHPAFADRAGLRGVSDGELRAVLVLRGEIPKEWNQRPFARVERHAYPGADDDLGQAAQLIAIARLLPPPNALQLPTIDEDDADDNRSELAQVVSLDRHTQHVVECLRAAVGKLPLRELLPTLDASALLHDPGKADVRFQAMLAGITPYEAMERPTLLGKGQSQRLTQAEKATIRERALLPSGFRHEMLSAQIVDYCFKQLAPKKANRELLLHLIASHHGHARPFAPVVIDDPTDKQLLSLEINGLCIDPTARRDWTPSHRLDSGVAERFWLLTRKYGWWGLAWLETVLRLADHRASAKEEESRDE